MLDSPNVYCNTNEQYVILIFYDSNQINIRPECINCTNFQERILITQKFSDLWSNKIKKQNAKC